MILECTVKQGISSLAPLSLSSQEDKGHMGNVSHRSENYKVYTRVFKIWVHLNFCLEKKKKLSLISVVLG